MEKYQEIAIGLGIDKLFDKYFDDIYEKLADLSSQVARENPARITDKTKESLLTLAGSAVHVGSTLEQYRETTKRTIQEGIPEDILPCVITAAS